MKQLKGGITKDDLIMMQALLESKKSKDPNTKVGCIIVDKSGFPISSGVNNFPWKCHNAFPWNREGELADTKYPYVVHAEANAIISAKRDLEGCTIYVTLFPCNECAKLIIQSGINTIFYLDDKYADTEQNRIAKIMLRSAGIKFNKITLNDELLEN